MSLAAFASYWGLCLVQATVVLLPGAPRSRALAALRARWALLAVPLAVGVGITFVPSVAALLARDLSLLALVAVPPLAALGLGWALRWHNPRLSPVALFILAISLAVPASRMGQAAALVLVALSSVTAGVLVVGLVPRAVAKAGIVLWAGADLSLALVHGLERASRAVTEATPALVPDAAHLQLQRVVVGTASMEYADLFVAAALGALIAADSQRRGFAALLVAGLAVAFSVLLFVTNVIPATVPVAAALGGYELRNHLDARWRRRRSRPSSRAPAASGAST